MIVPTIDLVLTLDYVRDACARYSELQAFAHWIEARIVPAFAHARTSGTPFAFLVTRSPE